MTNTRNILVTGANGQLGSEMRMVSAQTNDRYIFTDVVELPGVETQHLDITDEDAVRQLISDEHIDIIVNCAAYTNVDKAEEDIQLCTKLNSTAPDILARSIKSVGGLLIHISTDYVFGREPYNKPCREDQTGTPTGVYGMTKLQGEQSIISSECEHVIIRTAWLYSEFGRNFVKTMLNLTATKPQINVVFDQVGTPTYALDLAETIIAVIRDYKITVDKALSEPDGTCHYAKTGIYHYSNEGVCSWFDFTKMIAAIAGNTGCDIRPCHSEEFPSKVIRPAYSVLDKTKIKSTFGIEIPYWTDSLAKCLKSMQVTG